MIVRRIHRRNNEESETVCINLSKFSSIIKDLTRIEISILFYLMDKMNQQNEIKTTQRIISHELKASIASVCNCISKLEYLKLIKYKRKVGIMINPEIIVKDGNTEWIKKQYNSYV